MVSSTAETVEQYLAELPEERRETVAAVRQLVLDNLPDGYEEIMQYGMVGWVVPLERSGETYNGQPLAYVGLASQKQMISLYLMGVYSDRESGFREAYKATGKKLDMGKSCLRFKTLDDLPLDLIAAEIARVPVDEFIDVYQRSRGG